eukprot:TRINITY_DN1976_c0_g1_i1.p1 TRINITY_DN1976_c0_g1~~TRINITY_DN1976_c0_g1_i1.p1  ORF type:complete len:262 (+),score=60.37 TRINITY_DN1976_c0_g1_i1:183-968(+)
MSTTAIYIKGPDDGNAGTYVTNYLVAAGNAFGLVLLLASLVRARRNGDGYDKWLATLFSCVWAAGLVSFVAGGLLHQLFYDPATAGWAVFARMCWGCDMLRAGLLASTVGALVPAMRRHSLHRWRLASLVVGGLGTLPPFIYMMVEPVFRLDIVFEGVALGLFVVGLAVKAGTEPTKAERVTSVVGIVAILVRVAGGIFQLQYESRCGRFIRHDCPFPYDFNHNAIFHIFIFIGNLILIYPVLRWISKPSTDEFASYRTLN